jgi:putative transposase
MDQLHRKRIKHFEQERYVHELTFSCFQRRPLLDNDLRRAWFCEELESACERQQFLLLAYVLMPEHVHLLVFPSQSGVGEPLISKLLSHLKIQVSRRVKRDLMATANPLLDELTVRQRPGVMTFRFWQEGPGYDRNLFESKSITAAIDYIHANPVRRGLCNRAIDWPWSSARRLLNDAQLEGTPRLSRFDESLLVVDSQRSLPKHC